MAEEKPIRCLSSFSARWMAGTAQPSEERFLTQDVRVGLREMRYLLQRFIWWKFFDAKMQPHLLFVDTCFLAHVLTSTGKKDGLTHSEQSGKAEKRAEPFSGPLQCRGHLPLLKFSCQAHHHPYALPRKRANNHLRPVEEEASPVKIMDRFVRALCPSPLILLPC